MSQKSPIRGAVIGYGAAFNMGRSHLQWMKDAGIEPVAMCDIDPSRTAAAAEDYPGIKTFATSAELFASPSFDLVTVITPHNTHAELAIAAANAGKHVVVEKPMAITSDEATRMIDAAKKSGVTLSVFHNRRHDGDFLAIKEAIDQGSIGDVFQIQAGMGGWHKPGTWWRSSKEISGGLMYDWGAHFIDWILNLMGGHKVTQVFGALQKLVWNEAGIEDHGQIIIRFDNGAMAELTQSTIMTAPMPRWRILGTKGSIVDDGSVKDGCTIRHRLGNIEVSGTLPWKTTDWGVYYTDLHAHLRGDGPLDVTAEQARRIIAIIEAAEVSAKTGVSQPVAHEQ